MKEAGWYPPLNLMAVGTYLEIKGHHVEILDGQILSADEIIWKLEAELIGISFTCLSINNFDRITEAAKKRGAKVIAGGQAATALAKQVLTENISVDGVILFEGEEAMLALAQGKNCEEAPNLAFRKNNKIILPGLIRHFPLRDAPIPNRELKGVEIKKHLENFRKDTNGIFDYKSITNAYTKRGCIKRINGNGCSFCSRVDTSPSVYSPEKTWQEYRMLHEKYGIDCVFDYSDDFVFAGWLEKFHQYCLVKGKPGPNLHVFGCVEDMSEKNVTMLKEIGVTAILLGIESGDEEILRLNGKKHGEKQILEAAERIGKAGIRLYEAFVLGLFGESKKSVANTLRVSDKIRKLCQTEISYWNICQPLPGSKIWKMLMEDEVFRKKYGNSYHLDIEAIKKEYLARFTECTFEELTAIQNERNKSSKFYSREFNKASG
jgi:anaerobic magnesium-protoporphyrin IX monomethyl ester cyclase